MCAVYIYPACYAERRHGPEYPVPKLEGGDTALCFPREPLVLRHPPTLMGGTVADEGDLQPSCDTAHNQSAA